MHMFFPPQDRVFQIEITTLCNLKCEGCSRTVGIKQGRWNNRHMPPAIFKRAVDNARPSQAIILQGIGEPTLHPQLPELITIAKESGKFHTIAFYTNALARSIEYYDDLKARGHNLVTVSVDSLTQSVADECREGTDTKKLLQRLCELYYTHAPNLNISLVLSRKNLFDSFKTLETLNAIASAGSEYITVFIQEMVPTSDDIARDFILTPEEVAQFRNKMKEMKPRYTKLRLGLVGVLGAEDTPTAASTGENVSTEVVPKITLCDKAYYDRFVTIDGYMTPCCVMTDENEWNRTLLDRPLDAVISAEPISGWYESYEKIGHKTCAGCSLMSPFHKP